MSEFKQELQGAEAAGKTWFVAHRTLLIAIGVALVVGFILGKLV
jgi:hypothetical protein